MKETKEDKENIKIGFKKNKRTSESKKKQRE